MIKIEEIKSLDYGSNYQFFHFCHLLYGQSSYYNTPLPIYTRGYIGFTLSIGSSVRVSDRVRLMSPELLNYFFTQLDMVLYYHDAMCHAEKLVHYLQCQGHNKGLYNQSMTVFTISSKLLVHLRPNLV